MSTENDTPPEGATEVVSPFRPLPRKGRRKLADACSILAEEQPGEPMRQHVLWVDSQPPDDIVEDYELRVLTLETEVWTDEEGTTIRIQENAVEVGGNESSFEPDEIAERVRSEDRFTPERIPEASPYPESE